MELKAIWKNKISYLESIRYQEKLKKTCLHHRQDFAIGFECPSTITMGLRAGEQDLLLTKQEYMDKNISIVSIKRGGQATLHSEGQLVIYPIVDIQKNKMRVKDFIIYIEKVTQEVLLDLGIQTHKEEGQAGLFTSKGKIAFFGLHITEGISQHGLAINICNDLSLFSYIRSCGVAYRCHDKVSNYQSDISLKQLFDLWIQKVIHFKMGYSSVG